MYYCIELIKFSRSSQLNSPQQHLQSKSKTNKKETAELKSTMETQEICKILQLSNNVQTYLMLSEALNQRPNTTRNMAKATSKLIKQSKKSPTRFNEFYDKKKDPQVFQKERLFKVPDHKIDQKKLEENDIYKLYKQRYNKSINRNIEGKSVFEQMMKQ